MGGNEELVNAAPRVLGYGTNTTHPITMHACRGFLDAFARADGFDLARLEATTGRFAAALRRGVPGLRVHSFGSMLQVRCAHL